MYNFIVESVAEDGACCIDTSQLRLAPCLIS